jgi:hypothetical protein
MQNSKCTNSTAEMDKIIAAMVETGIVARCSEIHVTVYRILDMLPRL